MSHAEYVLLEKASELTGYTVKALNQKIDNGIWKEGEVWCRGPDGRRFVIMRGFHKWVEMGQASQPGQRASKLRSASTGLATA